MSASEKPTPPCGDCGNPNAPHLRLLENMGAMYLCDECNKAYNFNKPIWELQRKWKGRTDG